MSADSAHQSGWAIGEVVFGIPFLLGVALQFILPFSPVKGIPRLALVPVGIALVLAGGAFISRARGEFARFRQPTDPGQPTGKVLKTGVFAISRNPMYLGAALLFGGIGLAFNLPWALAALVLSIILCHFVLILPEERYLAARFGAEYADYAASVRRWIGRNRQAG